MKNISICIIAKNEESNIASCIKAINSSLADSQLAYEICLTDTGSTDDTIAIAQSLGATIKNYTWQNDFSAARNYAMSVAKYDYILFVDSDEILETYDWNEALSLLDEYPKYVGMITRRNLCNSGDTTAITVDKVARLFDKRLYHYELSIHEQLVANDNSTLTVFDIPLTFYHEGYMGTPEQLAAKANRNNTLLFNELKKTPNDPYIYYQIAQSYSLLNDKENQYLYCQKAYDLSPNIKDTYTTDLILNLGYAYINRQEYIKGIDLYNNHFNDLNDYADFLCFGALAHMKSNRLVEAIAICQSAKATTNYSIEGSNNHIPNYYLGCIYESFGNFSNALRYFTLANHYADSDKRIMSINKRIDDECDHFKKLSIIIPDNTIDDIDTIMNNILNQTMDINDMELIFIGNLSRFTNISNYESRYPDSIMLVNINEIIADVELVDIAISYSSGKYIHIHQLAMNYEFMDGLRFFYTATDNESCDIGACNITYGDDDDFYITVNSSAEATAISNANILLSTTNNKIYSRDFILKNNLDSSKLFNNVAIMSATKIYCSHNTLL